jgi:hypothetical protein
MSAAPTCPRCLSPVKPPGLWSSAWQCERHGSVLPFHFAPVTSEAALTQLAEGAKVPVWVPRPLPVGWVVSGIAWAGDERSGARATAVACTGPSPIGGPGDLVVVAEEPGVGLGARLAGVEGPDPTVSSGPPDFKVTAAKHPTALWAQPTGEDRSAFAGEAKAMWLEVVFWPARTSLLLLEHLVLADAREGVYADVDLVFGAPSPYLTSARSTV